MPQLEKNAISFDSADRRSRIAGMVYTTPGVKPFCLLQISHGMCEYIERYAHFAAFLAQNGVVVFGNDHIGHGGSAKTDGDLGYFGEKGGRRFALEDLKTMGGFVRAHFPGLPLVLLGHSMGSFFARQYATLWPEDLDGLILSGTGGPNPMVNTGIALAATVARLRGPRHRSRLIRNIAFGNYLKNIPPPNTSYDWVSSNPDVVKAYAADPHCNFLFTANGFHELFQALRDVSGPHWAVGVRKDMPVLMIQGDADPVGDYGRGTATVRDWLRGAGVKNLEYSLYAGMRHEVLNEIGREAVYQDVLNFLEKWWGRMAADDALKAGLRE